MKKQRIKPYSVTVEQMDHGGLSIYVQLHKGQLHHTEDIHDNLSVFADYSEQGKLLGIEILASGLPPIHNRTIAVDSSA